MKLNLIFLAPLIFFATAQELTSGQIFSLTKTINQNGHTYYKTRVETYTGQATTDPTSGTFTTVFTVENSLATYTKTVVVTYSQNDDDDETTLTTNSETSDDITTTITFSQQYQTYTKTLTGDSTAFDSESSDVGVAVTAGIGGVALAVVAFLL